MNENNLPKAQPQLRDLLDKVKSDVKKELNCHLVAQVESFDKAKNTITARASIKRAYSNGTEVEFPLFTDVPVMTLSGGGAFISMPITKGDWCLLMFNDRDIDSWWYSGTVAVPNSPRLHSLSDAIALVGLTPATEAFALVDDAVLMDAGEHKFNIKNDVKNLKTLLDKLITLVGKIIVTANTSTPSGGPVTWTSPLPTEFDSLKLEFEQLLKE
jgi:hypothetical protein